MSMSFFKFASLAHPAKYGYAFDTSAYSSNCETHYYFRQFETYGDGLVQHSGDWGVTFEYLADYCASLAAAMLDNPELVAAAGYVFGSDSDDAANIAFAAGVAWRESDNGYTKRRYVSIDLRKMGGDSKRYDKRFVEVNRHMDGSCASIMRLICKDYIRGFDYWMKSEAVRVWASSQKTHPGYGEGWREYFNGDWHKTNSLRRSVAAVRSLTEAARLRSCAEDWLSGYKGNLERAAEAERERVALIEAGAEPSSASAE